MLVRLVAVLGFLLVSTIAFSQDSTHTKKKPFRPDIPGSILIEFGFNFKNGTTPVDFQKEFWGSRTFNVYYQYPIRIAKSKFSINPGLGLSLERIKFSNEYTLGNVPDTDGSYPLIPASDLYPGEINRSFVVNNYIEMPIEFRFDTKPEDIARSFSFALGARGGILYDSFTKIDYTEGGEDKVIKDKQWHGMNRYRYGFFGKIGIAGFSVFCYYNVSPLFAPDKGPEQTKMNIVTVGLSLNGF